MSVRRLSASALIVASLALAALAPAAVRWITLGVWTVAHGGSPSAIRGIEFR